MANIQKKEKQITSEQLINKVLYRIKIDTEFDRFHNNKHLTNKQVKDMIENLKLSLDYVVEEVEEGKF